MHSVFMFGSLCYGLLFCPVLTWGQSDPVLPRVQHWQPSDQLLSPVPSVDPSIRWSQDARIAAMLTARLNPNACEPRVTVNSQQGHVMLMGTLDTPQAIWQAGQMARQTAGVVSVSNQLRVQHGAPPVPNMQVPPCPQP